MAEVKKMAKEDFDLDRMLSTASELKYTSEIRKVLSAQIEAPHEDFVRFFYQQVTPNGRFTSTMKTQFTPLVTRAFNQFLSDKVNDRLRSALDSEKEAEEAQKAEELIEDNGIKDGVYTTDEELEGFNIVRAIIAQKVPLSRVASRDTKSYFGILLDDNNRKPICRLWFNAKQKYLGIINDNKEEERMPIDSPVDIYKYSYKILDTLTSYDV